MAPFTMVGASPHGCGRLGRLTGDRPSELGGAFVDAGAIFGPDRPPSAELGRRIVDSRIETLGRIKRDLLPDPAPSAAWRPPSLTDAESLWRRFE